MAGMAGMGLGALPMNPALVAAALNQAGWGLIGNLGGGPGQGGVGGAPQPGGQPGDHGAFPTPTSFPATVAPGPTTVANSGTSNGSPAAPGFLGWGASPGGGAEQGPAQSQQTTPPQHGPAAAAAAAAGTWSNQPRDRQGRKITHLHLTQPVRCVTNLLFQEPGGNIWSKKVVRKKESRCK